MRLAKRFRRSLTHLVAFVAALGVALSALAAAAPAAAASPTAPAAAPADGILKVLLFYKPNFHASHVQARQAVRELANEIGVQTAQVVEIEETDDAAAFTAANLATKDAVVFAQTGGVLFTTEQRTALESYIRGGGGYMGMHYAGWSVGQSEHDVNPFYARLVGAMSEGHPESPAIRPGRVVVKATGHPLTQGLPAEFTRSDEWYDWTLNPAPNVRTLLEVDETSYGMGRQGSSHPITWCQQIDAGRSWYSGMGHEGTAYSEAAIRTQMKNGLAYAAGVLPADCSPPAKSDNGSWSGVTPWPLMPINMALTSDGKVQSFGSKGGAVGPGSYDWTGDETIYQGGQVEIDVWDPAQQRTLANLRSGIVENATYTDLFCSMQVQNPHNHATMTVGGDDGLGENAPNDGAVGVTSYTTNNGLQNEAPMNFPRWYPTGTTMPNGDIVVQGGSLRGGPGGPGILTPEVYTPDAGSGWKLLDGAKSAVAYGDGGNGEPDENRWWYPRAFVAPGSGNLFNISGTQMFELDPEGNNGTGQLTLRGKLPAGIANQGALGNPVGATSTAAMYRPGKILQVGGGWWANGGGPAGARAGFTVDLTTPGGTTTPVVSATEPMKFQRHWPTATVLPDGDVMVTGGSRENNGNGGYVTNAEIWDPETGKWTTVEVPYEHARLYHSTALLLPDGRVMIGGGGAPGPRNYTDVEYYSPSYLFDGDQPATRPVISQAPKKIGYGGSFQVSTPGTVSRVTLVRNGSVTHGFNNDQNFQDLTFTQNAGSITVNAPQDGTYAPPGAYMLFVWDGNGTPSVAKMLDIDPQVAMDSRTPQVVEQFEYPRFPGDGTQVVDVAPGSGRMTPWVVDSSVQLVRAAAASQGALGAAGYHVALGDTGSMSRSLKGLQPGREYRVSLRYARDSRSPAAAGPANARLTVGSLDAPLTAATTLPSQGDGRDVVFGTYVGTFTAAQRTETLRLAAGDGTAGMMVDNLVVTGTDPGVNDVPVHYELEEGQGTSAANTGTDSSVGAATLTGATGWSEDGIFGRALSFPGGSNANAVDLPDNLLQGATDFTTSFWVRPDTKGNWIGLFHIGDGLGGGNDASFFQIQMQTQAAGNTGLAATFKGEGSALQERVYATPTKDVAANQWNHVAFTRQGGTGTLYLNGEQVATRNDLTIDMTKVGPTTNNWLGRNGFPDPAYDGLMDEVRVYGSTLSAADVAALYDDGTALPTTTTVTADAASPSPFGDPVAFTASVEDEAGQPATGSVQLLVDGQPQGGPVELTNGTATFPEVTLSPGEHQVEVRFEGAEGFRGSVGTTTHTVSRPAPGEGVPIRYAFDEGTGTTAANSGLDSSVGPATLTGQAGWAEGQFDDAVNLPGGGAGPASGSSHVNLPNDITAGMDTEFAVSTWIRPTVLPNWTTHLQIGKSVEEFLLLQSSTENGTRGFAATLRANNGVQYRIQLPGRTDLPLNEWTHVVVTLGPSPAGGGTTGKIYFDGVLMEGGTRDNIPVDIGDIGEGGTTANFVGNTSWNDPRPTERVDELQIFGYELGAEQVAELFEGPVTNVAPTGVEDSYSTDEDQAVVVAAPGVLGNDTDADGDALTATAVTQPANGSLVLNPDGSFAYTPRAGFAGSDTFTYTANDGEAASAPVTVTITVRDVPAPPPAPASTSVSGSSTPFTYGEPGSLAVSVAPSTATGAVQVLNGATVLASGTLAAGKATLALPARSLLPGAHLLTLRYAGDASHTASSASVPVSVAKVTPTMKVKAPDVVGVGDRAKVKVKLSAANDVPVTGQVTVKVQGKTVTGRVVNGKVVLTLPKAARPGTLKLKVSYLGSDLANPVRDRVSIKVKR